jgi:hypothetical protein
MVDHGMTDSQIARALFVSTRTINHHMSSILAKLEVKTRTQAANKARQLLSGQPTLGTDHPTGRVIDAQSALISDHRPIIPAREAKSECNLSAVEGTPCLLEIPGGQAWASPARPDTGLCCFLIVPELLELSG